MFATIVVKAEGYSGGADALCLAGTLAAHDALVVLTDAYAAGPPVERASMDAYEAMLREDAERVLEERHRGHGLQVRVLSLPRASTSVGVAVLAQREGADLVVVPTAPLGAHAGDLVVELAAGHSPCPLAVAPRGYRLACPAPRIIAILFDAAPEARAAVRLAERVARAGWPAVVAIRAPTPLVTSVRGSPQPEGGEVTIAGDRA